MSTKPGWALSFLQVCSREVELEGLKSHLTRLLSGLDAHREAEQQVLAGHTARLSKEAARLEALQVNTARQLGPAACTGRHSRKHGVYA